MPFQLPPDRFDHEPKRLRDLQVGEQCAITFTDMRVDPQGLCYLNSSAKIVEGNSVSSLTVFRDVKGYHVIEPARSPSTRFTFLPKPSFWIYPLTKWYPVESFKEVEAKTG